MTQHYATSKIVTAWSQDRQDEPGYAVKYADGYTSWCPKDKFEADAVPLCQIGHLAPHEQRVVAELEQNADHLKKLEVFLGTPLFLTLPEAAQQLLKLQADAMVLLVGILNDRVGFFDIPTTSTPAQHRGIILVNAGDEAEVVAILRQHGATIMNRYTNDILAQVELLAEHSSLEPVPSGRPLPRYTVSLENGNVVFRQVAA